MTAPITSPASSPLLARGILVWTAAVIAGNALLARIVMVAAGPDRRWDAGPSASGALTAVGVVLAVSLWTRTAPWMAAGARRRDIGEVVSLVTVLDTLALVGLTALLNISSGILLEPGALARLALASVSMHVGALLTVVSFAWLGGWRSLLLLPLTAPVVPWVAHILEPALPGDLLTLVHGTWLVPALLVASIALHRMPAPRRTV